MSSGSWRIEGAGAVATERFASEGAAIARAWDLTPPGGARPSVFFDASAAPPPEALLPVPARYVGQIRHVGDLPRPDFERVGATYYQVGSSTAFICVAKDNARFATWEKINLNAITFPITIPHEEMARVFPWLVRPVSASE
jgi:hypothetical protein